MMRLKITWIADRGNHDKERIVMKATLDAEVGKYAIFRSLIGDSGAITTNLTDVFWFPDKDVKRGDLVVLYTKPGAASERPQKSAGTIYFYYWGKPLALWASQNEHVPVLVSTPDWQSFKDKD